MEQQVQKAIAGLKPLLTADRADLGVFFVDEDFGVAELVLRTPPETPSDAVESIRSKVRSGLRKLIPEVREIRFVEESAAPRRGNGPKPSAAVPPNVRAGLDLALDMLRGLDETIRLDASHGRLKNGRRAQRFLTSPCRAWIAEAADRMRALPPEEAAELLVPRLREIFRRLTRATRQIARLVERERESWKDVAVPPRGSGSANPLPEFLRPAAQEDYEDILRILSELRYPLGSRDLEGFLSVVDPASEEKGEYDAPMSARILNAVFKDAVHGNIRDVYIIPGPLTALLRYRVGRDFRTAVEFPRHMYPPILARLKKMAMLEVADRRKRQEGQFRFEPASRFGGWTVRLQTIPDKHAERVHLRLVPPAELPHEETP